MIQASVSTANPPEVKENLQKANVPGEVMSRIIAEGQRIGQIREGKVSDYVNLYWAAVNGLAIYKISLWDGFTMPDADFLVRMF